MAICQSAHHTLSIFQTSAKVERKNSSSTSSPFFLMNKKNLLAGLPTVAPYSPNPPKITFDLMWFHEFLGKFQKRIASFPFPVITRTWYSKCVKLLQDQVWPIDFTNFSKKVSKDSHNFRFRSLHAPLDIQNLSNRCRND